MTKPLFLHKSGIYQIRNVANNKVYIGQTIYLSERRYNHFRLLSLNKSHNPHLQSAYNKYGAGSFVFEILLYCDIDSLDYFEQAIVDKLKPEYNIRDEVRSNRGHRMSEETKRKISESQKGRVVSDEMRARISKTLTGRKINLSDEQREKMRKRIAGNKWNIGRKQTQEEIDKRVASIKKSWEGRERTVSLEARMKSSESHKKSEKTRRGEKNNKAVLTTKEVLEIRYLYKEGLITKAEIARNYGVSNASAGNIVYGKTWKHIPTDGGRYV